MIPICTDNAWQHNNNIVPEDTIFRRNTNRSSEIGIYETNCSKKPDAHNSITVLPKPSSSNLWSLVIIIGYYILLTSRSCEATEDTSTGKFSSESWRVVLILTGTVFAIIGLMIIAAALSAYKRPILTALGCQDPKVDVENEDEEEDAS